MNTSQEPSETLLHALSLSKHEPPLRVVIVGGVAGGMSAATRARRLDETASITVLEHGPYVSFANCGIPFALGDAVIKDAEHSLVLQTPQHLKERFNINVQVNNNVVRIDRKNKVVFVQDDSGGTDGKETKVPYDKLILSQGAEGRLPPIKGLATATQKERGERFVFALQTIPDLQDINKFIAAHSCKRVAIIGGGFIGLEAAENLQGLGLDVTLLETLPHVLPPIDIGIAEQLHGVIRRNGVKLALGVKPLSIESPSASQPGGVSLADGSFVPADFVIVTAGVRARTSLAAEAGLAVGKTGVAVNSFMQTSDPDIYAVGDMVETYHRIAGVPLQLALGGPANRQGRLAADHIFGRATPYRGNVGSFACKVFDHTVAATGLSVHTLRQLGHDPLWVTVHPPDHAGYYPGAHNMTLKVIFEPQTGRLLGAEAIGMKGIDKRIDVLSTALQAGWTIYDLEHLELAYAPPYSSAKDPVNMAGFVGGNLMRGDVQVIYADELAATPPDTVQIVDVRSPAEFATDHIPGAVNLPLDTLRDNLHSLDRLRQIVVYCLVGYRGYLGYRILKQMGFNVRNLDGGFTTFRDGGHSMPAKGLGNL